MILIAMLLATGPANTAEAAIARTRALTSVASKGCDTAGGQGEIVVCGRRDEAARMRLPLPDERDTDAVPRRATGERPAASAAPVRQTSCGVISQGQVCTGGLSVMAAAAAAARAITALADPDAILEPYDVRTAPPGPERPHHESSIDPR